MFVVRNTTLLSPPLPSALQISSFHCSNAEAEEFAHKNRKAVAHARLCINDMSSLAELNFTYCPESFFKSRRVEFVT